MFRIAIFLASLLCGSLAAWMTFAWQPAASVDQAAGPVRASTPAIEVLVAAAGLPQGHSLQTVDMRWQSWPEEGLTEEMIVRDSQPDAMARLEGSVVRGGFVAGEPMRDEKLVEGGAGFMAAILPSGKRAVAVRVSAENAAGGFILPDDKVDVIHTTQIAANESGATRPLSRTILSNIRVLAIDQNANGDGSEAVALGKTATLELSPHQVEVVMAAESAGSLSLALRSAEDMDEVDLAASVTSADAKEPPQERVVMLVQSGVAQQVTTRPSTRN
ncbi:Flp pilus assembly protein CpaB [Pelagibacterium sp. H642]|uniref:Flp pilus assembly protein CpaB n=1 Tax=Pelagibacterium sp. H642 TaxID=1881069 RepID=UPI0028160FBE|nr:Flp pilus assembly protein CpaB [Pelagibacterium sp. H642]WMT92868.1 Flp pilus assembly protein CpaB [Pelagibacterium sp. H642]